MKNQRSYKFHYSGCFGKEAFTRRDASTALRNMKQRKKHQKNMVYKCKKCGYYHIGDPTWLPRFKQEPKNGYDNE